MLILKSKAFTGKGWVYLNPDEGTEYASNHPVGSGEVPDATSIRRSTEMEDFLEKAGQAQFKRLERERADHAAALVTIAEQQDEIERLVKDVRDLLPDAEKHRASVAKLHAANAVRSAQAAERRATAH